MLRVTWQRSRPASTSRASYVPTHIPCTYKPREHQRQARNFFSSGEIAAHAPVTPYLSFGLIPLLAMTMRALASSLSS
jgi:hypothetical protein